MDTASKDHRLTIGQALELASRQANDGVLDCPFVGCEKSYVRRAMLAAHLRIHTGASVVCVPTHSISELATLLFVHMMFRGSQQPGQPCTWTYQVVDGRETSSGRASSTELTSQVLAAIICLLRARFRFPFMDVPTWVRFLRIR
jgi:hypothetical protein